MLNDWHKKTWLEENQFCPCVNKQLGKWVEILFPGVGPASVSAMSWEEPQQSSVCLWEVSCFYKGVGEWFPHGWGGWGAATRLGNEPCLLAWSWETRSLDVVNCASANDHKLSPVQSSLQTFHSEKVKDLERVSFPLQSSLSLKPLESSILTSEFGRRRKKGRKHQRVVPDRQLQKHISTTWLSACSGLSPSGRRWWTLSFSATSRSAKRYGGPSSQRLQQMRTINYI